MPLLTEALRGEGAILVDPEGHRFMLDEHPDGELAPRDVVSRAIWRRLADGIRVFLDARAAVGERFPSRFPSVFGYCQENGLDPRREVIPVSPAAHYHIGGIDTDSQGRTSMAGLWACGEVAATQLHGANRLASNSLLEALVVGARVARDIARDLDSEPRQTVSGTAFRLPPWCSTNGETRSRIRRLMWDRVGLVRNEKGLTEALKELSKIEGEVGSDTGEVRNMIAVGKLIAAAALRREESRGVHYRSDFPDLSPLWDKHIFIEQPATSWAEGVLAPS
jgi:L-aspartate oxidase